MHVAEENICEVTLKQNPTLDISDYDKRILNFLQQIYPKSVPLNLISKILEIETSRCSRRLASLERYGLIKRSTVINGFPFFSYNNAKPNFVLHQLQKGKPRGKTFPHCWQGVKNGK